MTSLTLNCGPKRPLSVLCFGCHSDDIEIGCGGAILRLQRDYPESTFHWVVFSATGHREEEARRAALLFAGSRLRGPFIKNFPDGFLPYVGGDVKQTFEKLKTDIDPDLIFTHNARDAHQDHRLVAELTWNTFRNHFILEYEIPKYDGDLGRPSVYMPLEETIYLRKLKYIADSFLSQQNKPWFREDTFLALLRLRGMECNSPSGFAEAFYCRKMVL
jgi:LmbE family N-acetylglucosaminyl deacetylase